jgi:hypothetical protein
MQFIAAAAAADSNAQVFGGIPFAFLLASDCTFTVLF